MKVMTITMQHTTIKKMKTATTRTSDYVIDYKR